jgi:hypothetical protein
VAYLHIWDTTRAFIRGDDPFTTKEEPWDKAIEGLTFVRGGLNRLAEFCIAQLPQ